MSISKYGIGEKQYELARSVLLLSAFVIGIKAWNIDLNAVKVFEIPVNQYGASVFLGMLGMILWIALAAYFVARSEQNLESLLNPDTQNAVKQIGESRTLFLLAGITTPLALFVYSLPFAIGLTAAWIVHQETFQAINFIFHHL